MSTNQRESSINCTFSSRVLVLCAEDEAKWADGQLSSDNDCDAALTVAGSSTSFVQGGVAQFDFKAEVDRWVLCYKHGSDEWTLYAGITPKVASTTTAEDSTSETQLTKALASLTLEGNIASYPAGSKARADFEAAFLADVTSALGEDASRFAVEDIRVGSIIVDFSITPTG